MSRYKLCWFTTLAAIIIFPAIRALQVRLTHFDGLIANSRPRDSELTLDELRSQSPPENQRVRSHLVFGTKTEISQTVFVPVQSKNPKDLGVGKLLVASRDLADPIFAKTVVLLVHYGSDSVVGLMLNRRSEVPLSRVFDQLKAAKSRSDLVYLGGPVEISAVFALVRSKTNPKSAERILGDVYLISTKSLFEKTLSARLEPGVFHVYLGYAGWTAEQLRTEVEAGAWFIFQGDAQTVFNSDPDNLWSQMIRKTELKMANRRPADASVTQSCECVLRPALYDLYDRNPIVSE
jgi:putative transcriptional regulator